MKTKLLSAVAILLSVNLAVRAGTLNNETSNKGTYATCALSVTITAQTNVSCNGGANGSATASATGGSGTYTYSWNTTPPQTTAAATGMPAGTFQVIVTDVISGCIDSAKVTITQPSALTIKDSVVNISCNGANNGKIIALVGGGTTSYGYTWSNGATTSSITNLSTGNYVCTVRDSNKCTIKDSSTITQPTALSSSATSTSAECGKSNGMAVASASGGIPPYSYSWAPMGGTKDTASNIPAGTYTCTVTDSNGCLSGAVVSVSGSTPPALSVTTTQDSGGCTGTATANASGGTSPYTYLWNGGQTTSTITSQCPGNYCCKITDSKGCTDSVCAVVTGISEVSGAMDKISIYPVPATGKLFVDIADNNFDVQYLEVFDVTGRLIDKVQPDTKSNNVELNISNLNVGMYLLKISGSNCNVIKKFL